MNAETSQLTEETSSDSTLCLLLLGKTGHGKSATGNAILGSKQFIASASCASVTTHASSGSNKVDGYDIKVVDTPGVADTAMDKDKEMSAKVAMQRFSSGIALCPEGFHALVLVFKFGQRMTDEERKSIQQLKEMLGENIIREWTILLVTHGDNFDEEEAGTNFTEWWKSQTTFMKDLLQECNNRFVLFNNKTKDKTELSRQRKELLDYANGLQTNGKRYTNWLFEDAREVWRKLTRERKYAKVIGEVDAGLQEISKDLQAALEKAADAGGVYFDRLDEKVRSLIDLIKDVEDPEKGKMEAEIKLVGERIKGCGMQANHEKREAERLAMSKEIELSRQRHQREMQEMQDKFNSRLDKLHEQEKSKPLWCVIA